MSKIVVALALMALCCAAASASVGLEPASGYIHTPNAQVVSTGSIVGYASYVGTEGSNELGRLTSLPVPCHGNGYTVGAVGGIGGKAELGVSFTSIDKSLGNASAFAVAGKWQILNEAKSGWNLAVGASYNNWTTDMKITDPLLDVVSFDLPAVTSVYVAADKSSTPTCGGIKLVKGTIGLEYVNFSSSQLSNTSTNPFFGPGIPISPLGRVEGDSFISPFIGARADFGKWSLLGEFRPELETNGFNYQSTLWSVAAQARIGGSTLATAGVSTFNLPYTNTDPAFFFEVSQKFGK